MKNVLNRATGEAMPSLTRRLFLRGAAIVAPLAAVPALAAAPSYVEENAKLLAMEPDLDAAEAEMIAATGAYEEAKRIGHELWPRAPECILHETWKGNREIERDVLGAEYPDAKGLWTARDLRDELKRWMRRRKITIEVAEAREQCKAAIEAAEAYEATCANVKATAGIKEAKERREVAAEALSSCISRIQSEPSQTMAGIRIKAKALSAWNHAPHFHRMVNLNGADQWMPNLARTLLETLDA